MISIYSEKIKSSLLISEYALQQNLAQKEKKIVYFNYPSVYSEYDIYFNGKGNVNMGQRIYYQDKSTIEFVIWLIGGRIEKQ